MWKEATISKFQIGVKWVTKNVKCPDGSNRLDVWVSIFTLTLLVLGRNSEDKRRWKRTDFIAINDAEIYIIYGIYNFWV